jgi:hypothetical protein
MRLIPGVLILMITCGACGGDDPGAPGGGPDGGPAGDAALTGEPHSLTANDISVLFPLPPAGDDALLSAATLGKGGPLLPRSVYGEIGLSVVQDLGDTDVEYQAMRVVAVRFDPCFSHDVSGTPCQPEVRLIFETVDVAGQRTFDGAVHALYNLDQDEFAALTAELRALTAAAPENVPGPLQVSPALQAQGEDGPYAQGLRALILAHCGAANLARLTFITRTDVDNGDWKLGGLALIEHLDTGFGPPGALPITGIDATIQSVLNPGGPGFEFTVHPGLAETIAVQGISESGLSAMSHDDQVAVHAWAMRMENPMLTTPDGTDCASCHLAGKTAQVLESLDPTLLTPEDAAARGSRVITTVDTTQDNLRQFGYYERTPYISQRAANDTRLSLSLFEEI